MTKDNLIKQMKGLLAELKTLESITNELDLKYEESPENEELEKVFDEAYQKEYSVMNQACITLVELIGADYKTARQMIMTKRNDIENLLNRIA